MGALSGASSVAGQMRSSPCTWAQGTSAAGLDVVMGTSRETCPTLVLLEMTGAVTGEHPGLIRGRMTFDSSPVMEKSCELLLKTLQEGNAGLAHMCLPATIQKKPSYVTE